METNTSTNTHLKPNRNTKNGLLKRLRQRADGIPVKHTFPMQVILPHIFKTRTESLVYSQEKVDFTAARKYIKEKSRNNPEYNISTFHLVIAALLRTLVAYPYLNRFISGKKLYARNYISFSFVVLKTVDGKLDETNAKLYLEPTDTLFDVAKKTQETIDYCRANGEKDDDKLMAFVSKLPSPMISLIVFFLTKVNDWGLMPKSYIDSDPLFTTAFISNLGSIGHGPVSHHLYEWGNASVFMTMGGLEKSTVTDDEGNKKSRHILDVIFTVDERVAYGNYIVKAMRHFRHLIKHPELLELPPDKVVVDDGI